MQGEAADPEPEQLCPGHVHRRVMDDPLEGPGLLEGGALGQRGRSESRGRVVAQKIALEPSDRLFGTGTVEEAHGHDAFPDDVVH